MLARSNGTTYQRQPDGSHKRIGGKPLSKKALKKLKREIAKDPMAAKVMEMMKDPGRQVKPHRSGGGVPLTFDATSANVNGLDLGGVKITVLPPAVEKPAPVRCLTPEARYDRADFEAKYLNHGECTCFLSPPCSYCTHPGNPLNQEDDSCYTSVIPAVVEEDPKRFMLSGLPSPFGGFVLAACVDCDHSDRCVNDEAALRSYDRCGDTPPPAMNVEQREWCLQEINAVEGWNRDDYEAVPDNELARAVIYAWGDYARDKGVV